METPLLPKIELRPYQTEGIDKIFAEWRSGKRSVLFQMPTGSGKTVVFAEIVRRGFDQGRKILIVAHRDELIKQIKKKLADLNIDAGLIVSGEESDYSKIVQVASIQTLINREHPDANLIIIDEAHHATAKSYSKLWEIYPEGKFLGVTATPRRYNGGGFEDLFDVLIVSPPVQQFIQDGYLVPIVQYACQTPDLSDVRKSSDTNDYITEDLSRKMLEKGLMGDLVESYQKLCPGKSMIVFAVDVEHSKQIVERYRAAGFSAAHIDRDTPKAERKQILADFRAKIIQIVCNVEIITEGFDFPECEVVQLARPTKSITLYLQAVGRIMRLAAGKEEGIILDNAGCWLEHGLAVIDREWTLEGRKKKEEKTADGDNILYALRPNGGSFKVNPNYPKEIKGLELVAIKAGLEDLMIFENYLSEARRKGYKLASAYMRYVNYLNATKKTMSKDALSYIKKRIAFFNEKVNPEKMLKDGFWFYAERELDIPD